MLFDEVDDGTDVAVEKGIDVGFHCGNGIGLETGSDVGLVNGIDVGTPRIVNEGNDVEKPKGEPTPVHRLGTPVMGIGFWGHLSSER